MGHCVQCSTNVSSGCEANAIAVCLKSPVKQGLRPMISALMQCRLSNAHEVLFACQRCNVDGPSLDKDDRLVHAMIRIDDRMTTVQHWISHNRLTADATAYFNATLPYTVHEYRSVVGH